MFVVPDHCNHDRIFIRLNFQHWKNLCQSGEQTNKFKEPRWSLKVSKQFVNGSFSQRSKSSQESRIPSDKTNSYASSNQAGHKKKSLSRFSPLHCTNTHTHTLQLQLQLVRVAVYKQNKSIFKIQSFGFESSKRCPTKQPFFLHSHFTQYALRRRHFLLLMHFAYYYY